MPINTTAQISEVEVDGVSVPVATGTSSTIGQVDNNF